MTESKTKINIVTQVIGSNIKFFNDLLKSNRSVLIILKTMEKSRKREIKDNDLKLSESR